MDWKLFVATFGAIFLAELGDKTQLAAVAISAQSKSLFEVWLAVVLALLVAGTLGVLAGKLLSTYINLQVIKYLSGAFFVLVGIWIILK